MNYPELTPKTSSAVQRQFQQDEIRKLNEDISQLYSSVQKSFQAGRAAIIYDYSQQRMPQLKELRESSISARNMLMNNRRDFSDEGIQVLIQNLQTNLKSVRDLSNRAEEEIKICSLENLKHQIEISWDPIEIIEDLQSDSQMQVIRSFSSKITDLNLIYAEKLLLSESIKECLRSQAAEEPELNQLKDGFGKIIDASKRALIVIQTRKKELSKELQTRRSNFEKLKMSFDSKMKRLSDVIDQVDCVPLGQRSIFIDACSRLMKLMTSKTSTDEEILASVDSIISNNSKSRIDKKT